MSHDRAARIPAMVVLALALLIGCAETEPSGPSLQTTSRLTPEQLAHYNDDFIRLRSDLWELSQLTYNEIQASQFKMARIWISEEKLRIETQKGGFSKGGVMSRFLFRGDFDIQIDCEFDFSRTITGMDQRLLLAVNQINRPLDEAYLTVIVLGKESGAATGGLRLLVVRPGRSAATAKKDMQRFSGQIRFVRQNSRIRVLHKASGSIDWLLLKEAPFTDTPLSFGFALQNFNSEMREINAAESIAADIDNFKVNSAQQITESDI